MTLRRKLVLLVLALGTVGGYASGCAGARCKMDGRRDAFEKRVADICVAAAKRADAPPSGG